MWRSKIEFGSCDRRNKRFDAERCHWILVFSRMRRYPGGGQRKYDEGQRPSAPLLLVEDAESAHRV